MPSAGEIKRRINSIREIQKITNAMKVVSASKLKRARGQLDAAAPFFNDVMTVMADILEHSAEIKNHNFDKRTGKSPQNRTAAIIVMTGDKGLSGGFDINVYKKVEEFIERQQDGHIVLKIVGRMGREHYSKLSSDRITLDEEFVYPLRDPSLYRAQRIADEISMKFADETYDDIYVVYTKMVSSVRLVPKVLKLLPMDLNDLRESLDNKVEVPPDSNLVYEPSPHEVFKVLARKYLTWIIYAVLVESFTSEQSARMSAMESATDNADEILQRLSMDYNRARQAAITQEISEIVGGAQAL